MRDSVFAFCGKGGFGSLLAVCLLLAPWCAHAQSAPSYSGVDPYEQYGKRIDAAEQVAPLTDTIFGDKVSLYNGATSFEATDVSISGNDALTVAVARDLIVQDERQVPAGGGALHGFGDWSLDVPYVWGTFTAQNGWTIFPSGATDRCSDNVHYPDTYDPNVLGGTYAPYQQIWNGDQLHIPGEGDQVLLANTQTKSPAYASAATYPWVTSGNWKVGCTASVANMAGQGFVAVSPQGVSYTSTTR